MTIFCYPATFKIRKKSDAEKLLNMIDEDCFGHATQDFYWHDDNMDYYISPKAKLVYERPMFCRGNIFDPYCQAGMNFEECVNLIWKQRKYINEQYFTREW